MAGAAISIRRSELGENFKHRSDPPALLETTAITEYGSLVVGAGNKTALQCGVSR